MRTSIRAKKRESRFFGDWSLPAVLGEGVLKYFRRETDAQQKEDTGESVGDLLDGLPAGFFLLNDLSYDNGIIDHILVGPKGIFTMKIQSHIGSVVVLGDQIFRNGRSLDADRDLIRQSREVCGALQELLGRRGITLLKPRPLIVFMKAVVGVHGTIHGVDVVQRNTLPDFMNKQKNVISPREAEGIFEFLKIGKAGSPL
ncbi:MAG TPA: NERD domain-containing protein [Candidatus Limnocylindrales bacterium]|nr:NERD domain-containing protein [Candidatus Limnocylindrales bacterium]